MILVKWGFRCIWLISATATIGCCTTPESVAVPPLPVEGPAANRDLLLRIRYHASEAVDAYYLDDWAQVEKLAGLLETETKFLGDSPELSPRSKTALSLEKKVLLDNIAVLKQAARSANVTQVGDALSQIQTHIRKINLEK